MTRPPHQRRAADGPADDLPRLEPAALASLDTALRELQSALEGRGFYGSGHPVVTSAQERALPRLREALGEAPSLMVARLGDRVVARGERLGSESILRRGLFGRMETAGFETLTIRRGFGDAELAALLDALHAGDADAACRDAGVRLGHLVEGSMRDGEGASLPEALEGVHAGSLVRPVGRAFESILRGGPVERDVLGRLVEQLGQAARVGAGALLPMRDLKRHDDYTFAHAINVGILACGLAGAAGLDEATVRDVTLAGMLHDAGKERVPPGLLNKPGRLTGDEMKVIEGHPAAGARLLLAAEGVPRLAAVVAWEHHMNADGSGYPRRPAGHRRHPASQIVQLADVFDALRTRRSYRAALPLEEVQAVLIAGRGRSYDGDLVDLFLREVVGETIPELPGDEAAAEAPRAAAA